VKDVFRDRGPLAGNPCSVAGLQRRNSTFVLAVDMPFVSSAFLQYLIPKRGIWAAACRWSSRSKGRWEPLCAVYRRKFADAVEKALLAGRNKIDWLFNAAETRVIDQQELDQAGFSTSIFRNMNTPEELEQEQPRA